MLLFICLKDRSEVYAGKIGRKVASLKIACLVSCKTCCMLYSCLEVQNIGRANVNLYKQACIRNLKLIKLLKKEQFTVV